MTMWIIIMWTVIVLFAVSLGYLGISVPKLLNPETVAAWSKTKYILFCSLVAIGFAGAIALCLDIVNAIVCVLYFAMIWAATDFVFWAVQKTGLFTFEHYYAGWTALAIGVLALSAGWYLDHHVWQTSYELKTAKDVPDLKVAMFADSHIGTTFDAEGFAKHLETIQAQNPDIVVVVGDYVDDGTKKEDMIKSSEALGRMKTKYGVFFVSGNHDKGYYGPAYRGFSEQELFDELQKNNIKILRDETVSINDAFYLIGRRDFSEVKERKGARKSMEELVKDLDKSKYMIVLDHQPTDFKKQAEAKVDLVLCGHTHGGQLFPFNQVGKWIKANDLIYGHEKRDETNFIVTSGISDWAIKFKTGTKSEYVMIDIKKGK